MRFLVTAGNTREMIDAVRDWGNVFTGNTGYAIARALATHGQVDLLTSNRGHLAELSSSASDHVTYPIHGLPFSSHADLRAALAELMTRQRYDAVFMTAAVADYRPAGVYAVLEREPAGEGEERWLVRNVQSEKVKSTHARIAVLGEPTEKLVDLFRSEWRYSGMLVKFKLEVGLSRDDLIRVGQSSRLASGADYLVANTLDMVAGPGAGAFLLSDGAAEWVARDKLSSRLAALAATRR